MNDVTLHVSDDALRHIAEKAMGNGTGARGLRQIMERVLNNAMYDIPDQNNASAIVVETEIVATEETDSNSDGDDTKVVARILYGENALEQYLANENNHGGNQHMPTEEEDERYDDLPDMKRAANAA